MCIPRSPRAPRPTDTLAITSLIRTIGAASAVLLKNQGSVLPLKSPKTMAIVGTGARSALFGANECLDHSCNDGVLAVGWGSGCVHSALACLLSMSET